MSWLKCFLPRGQVFVNQCPDCLLPASPKTMGGARHKATFKNNFLANSVKISLLLQAYLAMQCPPFPQAGCFLKSEESQTASSNTFHLKVVLQAGHIWAALHLWARSQCLSQTCSPQGNPTPASKASLLRKFPLLPSS